MLKNTINYINLFGIVLFIFLGIIFYEKYSDNVLIFTVNFLHLLVASTVIYYQLRKEILSEQTLIKTTLVINIVFMVIYVILIYDFSGELFMFIPSDAPMYDDFGRWAAKGSFLDGIATVVSRTQYGYDDMGFVFFISILYRIIDTPIIIKVVNVFINLITIVLIYRLSNHFMPNKYAYIAALVFGIASYTIWFLVSGLKEPLMLLMITYALYYYYKYIISNRIKYIILTIIFASTMLFFRIPILFFLIAALLMGEFLRKGTTSDKLLFILIIYGIMIIFMFEYSEVIIYYIERINPIMHNPYDERITHSNTFLSIIVGFFGPFPTIVPADGFEDVSVYAPSLLIKVFLSPFFVISIILAFRQKVYSLLPLIFFCLIQITTLSFIDQTFKLRYSFIHFPFFIIAAIFSIYILTEYKNKYYFLRKTILINIIILTGIVFFWNYLRI